MTCVNNENVQLYVICDMLGMNNNTFNSCVYEIN